MVSGMQVLDKSYSTKDHVYKIHRSLQVKWIPKVTTIRELKDLKKLGLESLISNLMSHVLKLNHDEAKPKAMSITLRSNGKTVKALQAEDEAPEEADEDVELSDDDNWLSSLEKLNNYAWILLSF